MDRWPVKGLTVFQFLDNDALMVTPCSTCVPCMSKQLMAGRVKMLRIWRLYMRGSASGDNINDNGIGNDNHKNIAYCNYWHDANDNDIRNKNNLKIIHRSSTITNFRTQVFCPNIGGINTRIGARFGEIISAILNTNAYSVKIEIFSYRRNFENSLPIFEANNAIYYNDVIMGTTASQITSLTIVYSTVYWDAYQIKYQSSTSLAFVRGIHRGPVNSPHKWPVTRKMFPFDSVIMVIA